MESTSSQAQLEHMLADVRAFEASAEHGQLLELLRSLDEGEEPTANGGGVGADPSLLERYQALKREYVTSKAHRALLDHLARHGLDSAVNVPVPTDEERRALQERQLELQGQVQDTLQQLNAKAEQVRLQYATWQARKQELEQRVQEFQQAQANVSFGLTEGDSDDESITEDALAAQGERLAALQLRKGELLRQIQRAKQEHRQLAQKVQEQQQRLPADLRLQPSSSSSTTTTLSSADAATRLQQLRDHNAQLEKSIADYSEMSDFYLGLRECLEELRGVRVLQVSYANGGRSGDKSDPMETDDAGSSAVVNDENRDTTLGRRTDNIPSSQTDAAVANRALVKPTTLICEFLLLESYELVIELDDQCGIPRVIGPRFSGAAVTASAQTKVRSAYFRNLESVVSLDDLVASLTAEHAHNFWPTAADAVRWILTEALARLHIRRKRSEELQRLQQLQLSISSDGPARAVHVALCRPETVDDPTAAGATTAADQHIECRFPVRSRIAVAVLRLTPDCPWVPGSVYLDRLQWDGEGPAVVDDKAEEPELQTIQAKVNAQTLQFSSPVDLVQCLAKELEAALSIEVRM